MEDALPRLLEIYDREDWVDEVVDRNGEGVDWDRLAELMETASVRGPLAERIAALRGRYERPYPSLVTVGIDAPADFSFVPGQYVTVRYDGVPRPYSLSCSPNAGEVEICVRRVPGGKLSERLCTELSPGDGITLRGPNGDFVLQEPSDRDLAFLATGTGVAPLASMIEYLFEEGWDSHDGRPRDVWLFLGAGWEDDLPFRDRFRELDRTRNNFHFVPTLTREPFVTDWGGETDYVQRTLLKYVDEDAVGSSELESSMRRAARKSTATDVDATIDPSNLEVYACGINAMVYALSETVSDLGVESRYVRSEGYG
jgi:CDP-4-dehydro-6-deoxyglucose reductase